MEQKRETMGNVYQCRMVKYLEFDIRAESEEEALDWIQTHDFTDVMTQTTMYDLSYDEYVVGTSRKNTAAIDIRRTRKGGI